MEQESLSFLGKVFDLLNDGKAFDTQSNEPKAIVDFRHPEELKVGFEMPSLFVFEIK